MKLKNENPISSLEIQYNWFVLIVENAKLTKWIDNEQYSHEFKIQIVFRHKLIIYFHFWHRAIDRNYEQQENMMRHDIQIVGQSYIVHCGTYQVPSTKGSIKLPVLTTMEYGHVFFILHCFVFFVVRCMYCWIKCAYTVSLWATPIAISLYVFIGGVKKKLLHVQ